MPAPFKIHMFCCLNQRPEGHAEGCCASKGAEKIFNYLKARSKELGIEGIRVNRAGCLDACAKGPAVVVYPSGTWHTIPTIEAAEEFLQAYA